MANERKESMRELNEKYGLVEDAGCMGVVAENIMTGATNSNRDDALTHETDELFIDTCCCFDTGYWETAVETKKYDDHMIIVEEYDSEDETKIGHKKWVGKMTAKILPKSLESIQDGEVYKLKK